jgi:uncharacterized membrane protein YebE (DUF533 family)
VLTSAALLVVGATVYPALPSQLLRHSSGQCWPKANSALLMPAVGIALGALAAVMNGARGTRPVVKAMVALDLLAYGCCFATVFGLVPAALGYTCR